MLQRETPISRSPVRHHAGSASGATLAIVIAFAVTFSYRTEHCAVHRSEDCCIRLREKVARRGQGHKIRCGCWLFDPVDHGIESRGVPERAGAVEADQP